MPTRSPIDQPSSLRPGATTPPAETTDGRQLRRLRNIEAVRSAILDLHLERASLDLDTVASRAGVTVRSIYRYYADLDAAIDDATGARLEELYRVWRSQVMPRSDEPLITRIEAMIGHRMELERLGRPLRNLVQKVDPDPGFDQQVCEVFAFEFSWMEDEELEYARAAVCFLLRPGGLRPIIESPPPGGADPQETIAYLLLRLLSGAPTPSGDAAPAGTIDSRNTN